MLDQPQNEFIRNQFPTFDIGGNLVPQIGSSRDLFPEPLSGGDMLEMEFLLEHVGNGSLPGTWRTQKNNAALHLYRSCEMELAARRR